MLNDDAWEAHCQAQDVAREAELRDATCMDCFHCREFDRADGTIGHICIEHMYEILTDDTPRTFECEEYVQ